MNWSAQTNDYCERTDLSFWSEPVNALTNAAFLLTALAAFIAWRRAGGRDLPVLLLILVTVTIGFGSFAFHTFATRAAELGDVIPIAVFIYGYFVLALRRYFGLGALPALAIVLGFLVLQQGATAVVPRDLLNGSVAYLPALVAMLVLGLLLRARMEGRAILLAAGVLTVSLFFRTVDNAWCEAFPLGTHFLWHLLNAVVLYIVLRVAIAVGPAPAR